jgi:L-arabinose isomerase
LGFKQKFITDEQIEKADLSNDNESKDLSDLLLKALRLQHKIKISIDEFFEEFEIYKKTGSFENFKNLDKEVFDY